MKHLGLIAILACLVIISVVMRVWYKPGKMTTSLVVAEHPTARILFGLCLTIGGILFSVFMLEYFIPTFHLPSIYNYILLFGISCQIIAAWVPDLPGRRSIIHNVAAYSLGMSLLYLGTLLTLSDSFSRSVRLIDAFLVIIMTILTVAALRVKKSQYIFYQQAYIVCFWIIILVNTYINWV